MGQVLHGSADERGSIVAISNGSGTVTQINAYDDHGIPQGKTPAGALIPGGTATASFGRFGYTGQAWLAEVGLHYYKNRMYSPTLGRFMQSDPIGYGDGVNLYTYVGGDPINAIDPSGLLTFPNGTGIDENDGQSGTEGGLIIVTAQIGGGGFISTGLGGSQAPAGFGTGTGFGLSPTPNANQANGDDRRRRQKERVEELTKRVIEVCGPNPTGAECARLRRQRMEAFTGLAKDSSFPPIGRFRSVRPALGPFAVGVAACVRGVISPPTNLIDAGLGAAGCAFTFNEVGSFVIPVDVPIN
jgi:RHS repeat-associated protein